MKKSKPNISLKNRISQWRMGDFLRQLSVVVLRIIIIFVGGDLISQAVTRNKVKTAINLLVTELTDNQTSILAMKHNFVRERDFGQYKDSIAGANFDTLERSHLISAYRDMQTAAGNAKFYYENKSDIAKKLNDDASWWVWYETVDPRTIAASDFFREMVTLPLFGAFGRCRAVV